MLISFVLLKKMFFYFCGTLVNLKDSLLKKFFSFFEVEKNVNFRELGIFAIFRGRNFRELPLQFEIHGL